MLNMSTLRDKRAADEDGFTLIELLVVVVILGILIAIAIPVYLNYQKGANDKAAQSDVRNAVAVLEQCNTDNAKYPATADFPTTGGAFTGSSCLNQKINLSANSSMKYTASAAPALQASYILVGTNSSGSKKMYCYNSANGGQVQDVQNAGGTITLAAATC